MYSKTIEQIMYSNLDEARKGFRKHVDNLGAHLADMAERARVNNIRDRWINRLNKRAYEAENKDRKLNQKLGFAGLGAGTIGGGALGYALSKRATKNMASSKKRSVIRVGSTIVGAGLGGYAAGAIANKYIAPRRSARTLDLKRRANKAYEDFRKYNS